MSQQEWLLSEKPGNLDNQYSFRVYWASFKYDVDSASVPFLVEQNADSLKEEYLQWLHDLGHTQIRGRSIIDHLSVRDDFSLWWMSLLVEKSQWKSPHLYNCFRVMAFARLLSEKQPDKVIIEIDDRDVCEAITACCNNTGIACKIVSKGTRMYRGRLGRLPHPLQALVMLAYRLVYQWTVRRDDITIKDNAPISFISYFFNVDIEKAKHGIFRTRYWTKLHAQIEKQQTSIRWLHLHTASEAVKRLAHAMGWIKRFNADTSSKQSHMLINGPLTWVMIASVIKDYLKLTVSSLWLGAVDKAFLMRNGGVNLWPLMCNDWCSSVYGRTAIVNLLFLAQFEVVLKQSAPKKRGFYLMEGQGWERALIYAWKNAGHGELMGVPHTVICPWDLRHFFNGDDYRKGSLLPSPDKVVLNGEAAISAYIKHGFSESRIVKGEALRYLYLGKQHTIQDDTSSNGFVLLVLGEILPKATHHLMNLLAEAAGYFPDDVTLWAKAHPGCPIDPIQWPMLNMKMIDQPLDTIVGRYQIAFTSNSTSAAVDAYLSGSKVVTMLDPDQFNMSPLRGYVGVDFVSTADELVQVVTDFHANPKIENGDQLGEFFFTDEKLPRWKGLLEV